MGGKDLRAYLKLLEEKGELLRVSDPVHWKYEVAAWTRYSYNLKTRGPALLFENVIGYPPGYRILTAAISTRRRFALALGLDEDSSFSVLIRTVRERISRPREPEMVASGPVKENVHLNEDIDLLEFPVPWWTPRDGGRYLGTWHGNVTRNARTGVRNVGVYRMQLYDRTTAGIGFSPGSNIGLHFRQRKGEEPLEMAVVIGVDETLIMAASSAVPEEVDEYAVAGGLREEPLKLVRCETVDLAVPAAAEIVIEGKVFSRESRPEGPFGEYVGFHSGNVGYRPLFKVTAVTHRNNPIFRGTLSGRPTCEDHFLFTVLAAAGWRNFYGSRKKEKLLDFLFARGFFRGAYRLYPFLIMTRGYWPPVCTPPRELMKLVETKWRKAFGGKKLRPGEVEELQKKIEEIYYPEWEEEGRRFRSRMFRLRGFPKPESPEHTGR